MSLVSRAIAVPFSKGPAILKMVGYVIFFIAALMVFTYARLSSDIVTAAVNKAAGKASFKISVSNAKLAFPPALSMSDISIIQPLRGKNREALTINSIVIKPSLRHTLFGELGGQADARTLGGDITIRGWTEGGSANRFDIEFSAREVDPGLLSFWEDFPWARISGSLDGDGKITINEGDIQKGSGAAHASVTNGEIALNEALLSGDNKIKLDTATLDLAYDGGKLTVKRGDVLGPQIKATLSGDVIVAKNPAYSRLNLKIKLKLMGALQEKLGPFLTLFPQENGEAVIKIGGTVRSPVTR